MIKVRDGSKLKTIKDFHTEIQLVLELPDYYGENLDVLWDCLTGCIPTPLTLIWINFDVSEVNLKDFALKALSVFKEAEKNLAGFKIEYRRKDEM